MKQISIQNLYEVKITGFDKPVVVSAWDFPHAYEKVLCHISRLETKDAHSVCSITYVSPVIF